MFSTTPSTGTSSLRNMSMALRTSSRATSWGVVTTTAPETGTSWHKEIWASPVPGGRSTTSTSRSPQRTSSANCRSSLWIMGPRQMTARPGSTKYSTLMAGMPR